MSSVLYAYSIAFPKSFLLCWLVNGFVLKKKKSEREREEEEETAAARLRLSAEHPLMVRAAGNLSGSQWERVAAGLMLTPCRLTSSLMGMVNNKLIKFSGRRKMRWEKQKKL